MKRSYSVPPKGSRMDLVTFAKLQRELFKKIRQKERVWQKSLKLCSLLSGEHCSLG